MPEKKRIVFSNETPNDQGGIIPNDCLDFSRYNSNPVILAEHNWDGTPESPFCNILGLATDIKKEGENYTMIPQFHGITEQSKIAADLYEQGFLRACSVGGEAFWKTVKNLAGQEDYFVNADGLRVCEKFLVYEISMVALPSNPDATQLKALQDSKPEIKVYEKEHYISNITKLSTQLNKLKTNLNSSKMTPEELAAAKTELEGKLAKATADLNAANEALNLAKEDASKKAEAESALAKATPKNI